MWSSLARLPPFDRHGNLHVVVETPRGSTGKIKLDKKLGVFTLSRPLPAGMAYPFDWGFVPGTKAPDGDPVDVLVIWDVASFPGVLLHCRAIGVMEAEQDRKRTRTRIRNDRLLAVPVKSPRQEDLQSVFDMPGRMRDEIEHFFVESAQLEHKNVRILGWKGPDVALAEVKRYANED